MNMNCILQKGAKIPTKAHESDAGFDLYSRETKCVPKGGSTTFDTGVCIQIPEGMTAFLKSKSGLNVKHGIQSEGVIDCGYTGSIVVKLYNHSNEDYIVNCGDKITQLVLLPIPPITITVVDILEKTERGDKGFGSSGK
jgi:dUTP pyrophosphatase